MSDWADKGLSGLSEVRDQRELATLCAVLDGVNRQEIGQALDIIVCRIFALVSAKGKGGNWEKASRLELVGGSAAADLRPAGLSGIDS